MRKIKPQLLWAVLPGAVLGAAGVTAMHARQMKMLPGYVVAEVDVTDPATFKQYSDKAPGMIAQYGGRYVIRGGNNTPIESDAPKRIVVIQFENVEKAKAWEDSPA